MRLKNLLEQEGSSDENKVQCRIFNTNRHFVLREKNVTFRKMKGPGARSKMSNNILDTISFFVHYSPQHNSR